MQTLASKPSKIKTSLGLSLLFMLCLVAAFTFVTSLRMIVLNVWVWRVTIWCLILAGFVALSQLKKDNECQKQRLRQLGWPE